MNKDCRIKPLATILSISIDSAKQATDAVCSSRIMPIKQNYALDNKHLRGAFCARTVVLQECINGNIAMKYTTDLLLKSGSTHITEVRIPSDSVLHGNSDDWGCEAVLDDEDYLEVLRMSEDQVDDFLSSNGFDPNSQKAFSLIDSFDNGVCIIVDVTQKIEDEKIRSFMEKFSDSTVGEALNEIIANIELEERKYNELIGFIKRSSGIPLCVANKDSIFEIGDVSLSMLISESMNDKFIIHEVDANKGKNPVVGKPLVNSGVAGKHKANDKVYEEFKNKMIKMRADRLAASNVKKPMIKRNEFVGFNMVKGVRGVVARDIPEVASEKKNRVKLDPKCSLSSDKTISR